MPAFDFVQVRPPSSLTHTPPLNFELERVLHIFGRGKSCVPLFALHILPRTFGSNSIQ
jgi:hypothetical protein